MDGAEVKTWLERKLDAKDPELEYMLGHHQFVADMPQSGERFPSREPMLPIDV